MKSKFSIRFFVETSNIKYAESISQQVISFLRQDFEFEVKYIKKYWKITEYFECLLEAQDNFGETEKSFTLICDTFGEDWMVSGSDIQTFGVWNPSNSNISRYEKIKWVNVEILEST